MFSKKEELKSIVDVEDKCKINTPIDMDNIKNLDVAKMMNGKIEEYLLATPYRPDRQ